MPTATADELIDRHTVEELRDAMGPEAFADIATTFCDQVTQITQRFVAAAHAADRRQASLAAHELVGLAGTVGAPRLAQLSRRAMARCRDESDTDCGPMAREMETTAAETLEAFQSYF